MHSLLFFYFPGAKVQKKVELRAIMPWEKRFIFSSFKPPIDAVQGEVYRACARSRANDLLTIYRQYVVRLIFFITFAIVKLCKYE